MDELGTAHFIPYAEVHDLYQLSGRSMGQALPPYLWELAKSFKSAICRLAPAVIASPYVSVRLGNVLGARRHLIQFEKFCTHRHPSL